MANCRAQPLSGLSREEGPIPLSLARSRRPASRRRNYIIEGRRRRRRGRRRGVLARRVLRGPTTDGREGERAGWPLGRVVSLSAFPEEGKGGERRAHDSPALPPFERLLRGQRGASQCGRRRRGERDGASERTTENVKVVRCARPRPRRAPRRKCGERRKSNAASRDRESYGQFE